MRFGDAKLRHNRFGDFGFASDEDYDTEKSGVQKATVADLNLFQVNAARGDEATTSSAGPTPAT